MGVKVRFWKGAWWVFVSHHGRRKAKRIGDKATALRVAKAIRERIARGDLNLEPATDAQTLRTYAAAWLEGVKGNLKASTVAFYDGHLNTHVLPALGDRVVSGVRRRDCREFVAACRAKGLQLATVKGILRTLSTILSAAVKTSSCRPTRHSAWGDTCGEGMNRSRRRTVHARGTGDASHSRARTIPAVVSATALRRALRHAPGRTVGAALV